MKILDIIFIIFLFFNLFSLNFGNENQDSSQVELYTRLREINGHYHHDKWYYKTFINDDINTAWWFLTSFHEVMGGKGGIDDRNYCDPELCTNGRCSKTSHQGVWCFCHDSYFGPYCNYRQHVVYDVYPANLDGGDVLINGTFINIDRGYNITIGDNKCKISLINQTTIICNIGSFNNYDTVRLNISQNEITWYQDYNPFPKCQNGEIKGNKCICNDGFEGNDCENIIPTRIDLFPVLPNIKGGLIYGRGWFPEPRESLKFIIGTNITVNITSIGKNYFEGFVGPATEGFHNVSIYNNTQLLRNTDQVRYIADPCLTSLGQGYREMFPNYYLCLCHYYRTTLGMGEDCSRYVQNEEQIFTNHFPEYYLPITITYGPDYKEHYINQKENSNFGTQKTGSENNRDNFKYNEGDNTISNNNKDDYKIESYNADNINGNNNRNRNNSSGNFNNENGDKQDVFSNSSTIRISLFITTISLLFIILLF